jgi:putative nucleotidyltransferase with HDIG domain
VARDIPVLTQREVEALARMTAVTASETVRHEAESFGWERRLREAEVFAEAGEEFVASDAGQDATEVVLGRAMRLLDADSGALMLRRALSDILEVVAASDGEHEFTSGQRVRVGEGVAGRVAQTGRSVLISAGNGDGRENASSGTMVCVPLQQDGELLGVLSVSVSGSRRLVGDEVSALERFSEMASRFISNANGRSAARRQMHEHMHLGAYAKALGDTSGIDEVVQITTDVLDKALEFDVAGLAILGWGRDEVTVVLRSDVPENALEDVLEQAVGRDIYSEPFEIVTHVTHSGQVTPATKDAGDWTTMAVEVMMRDTLVAYLFVAGHESGMFDGDDRRLLLGMADYAAAALEKASLFVRLRDDYAKTIAALGAALDLGERKEFGHSDRVMDYAVGIGEELGLAHEDIETLRFAGLLHDVGKLGLSEEILLKPSRLTRIEMEKMRRHAEFGAGIVEQIEFLDALAPVIMHHHERWDGEGYPIGLAGEDIPLLARVLGVADAFDAMTSENSHKPKMALPEARKELRAAAGTQFDPRVVAAMLESLDAQARAGATGLLADTPQREEQLPS